VTSPDVVLKARLDKLLTLGGGVDELGMGEGESVIALVMRWLIGDGNGSEI
jgi:hypothetical protein